MFKVTHKETDFSSHELASRGPIVQVCIGLHQVHTKELIEKDKEIPKPFIGMALIDTGADQSCIDHTVIDDLGLLPIGETLVVTPDGTQDQCPVYPVQLKVGKLRFDLKDAIGLPISDMHPDNMIALIGRDILKHCFFIYHGPTGDWMLGLLSEDLQQQINQGLNPSLL